MVISINLPTHQYYKQERIQKCSIDKTSLKHFKFIHKNYF